MGCTFHGTAKRIEVSGHGTSSLVRAMAFEQGLATRVELETANVGPRYSPVMIDAPETLDPVDLYPSAKGYKVVYTQGSQGAASKVRIDIEAGAARSGHFQGKLAGAPLCETEEGCPVVWPDTKRIALTVVLNSERVAAEAQKGTPIRLTGWFPFVDHARDEAREDRVDHIALDGAAGKLDCDGKVTTVEGNLVWSPDQGQSARIGEPAGGGSAGTGITVTPEGLHLTVTSTFEPQGQKASPALWIAGGAAAVVLFAVALVLFFRRKKGSTPSSTPDSTPGSTPASAPGSAPAGSTPHSTPSSTPAPPPAAGGPLLVLLAAPADAGFSAALAKQLVPYKEQVYNPHDPRSMPPGADIEHETAKAIERAAVVAVVVSADLFSASTPWSTLLQRALALHKERGLQVVPVLARPSTWEASELGTFKALPSQGVIGAVDNDAALAEVAEGLASVTWAKAT